ncbi:hypothetical protein Tco_1539429 [Tanacetum coccineum]
MHSSTTYSTNLYSNNNDSTNEPFPSSYKQQSTTESELAERVTALENKFSDLEQTNKNLDNMTRNLGSRVYTLELRITTRSVPTKTTRSVPTKVNSFGSTVTDTFLVSNNLYPKVQESLKFPADEHVILEDPLSSTGTLSSMKNLEDAHAIGDQFINDKSTDDEPAKLNVEAEVVSMITVPIYQASSLVPPLLTPVIDISPPKPASSTT